MSEGARTEVRRNGFVWDSADVLQVIEQYRSNKKLVKEKM